MEPARKKKSFWGLALGSIMLIGFGILIIAISSQTPSGAYKDGYGNVFSNPICISIEQEEIVKVERVPVSGVVRTLVDLSDGRTLQVSKIINSGKTAGIFVISGNETTLFPINADGPFQKCPLK